MRSFHVLPYSRCHQANNERLQPLLLQITEILFSIKVEVAKLVSSVIPASCPFARNLSVCGYSIHIPPLCKFNPLYPQLMSLRFQAMTFISQISEK